MADIHFLVCQPQKTPNVTYFVLVPEDCPGISMKHSHALKSYTV